MKPVLISGAGIAGKSIATMFQMYGIPYKIIDRMKGPSVAGAGIALPANAMTMADYMGIGNSIRESAYTVSSVTYATPTEILSTASLKEPPLNQNQFVALKRSELDKVLSNKIETPINYSTKIASLIEDSSGVSAILISNGEAEEDEYSAVIGADGIHSKTRSAVFANDLLTDFDLTIFRWVCPWSVEEYNTEPFYMFDHDRAFMAYPISRSELYCYSHITKEAKSSIDSLHVENIIQKLFSDCSFDLVQGVLSRLSESSSVVVGKMQAVNKPTFTKGKIALIGDASHACTPMLQQGAALAFEDAIVIAKLLDSFPPQKAFLLYEQFRKEEISNIVYSSNTPIREMTSSGFNMENFYSIVRANGPINVQGWKKIITDRNAFFDKLDEYILLHKRNSDGIRFNFSYKDDSHKNNEKTHYSFHSQSTDKILEVGFSP